MPVPTPSRALPVAFRVLCLRCLQAKAHGIQSHDCVWSSTSSKCGYCTSQHSPCVPLPWFLGEEFAALLAAQSITKFHSEAERDLYEEARATRAALELGLAQIQSSLRRLRTEQESVPALLGELVAAVGKLPTAAAPVPSAQHKLSTPRQRAPITYSFFGLEDTIQSISIINKRTGRGHLPVSGRSVAGVVIVR
ncbi:hypothetical protein GMDG_07169 [Pseudogymnoascus destructans 20631-21]|uniref:Uncharacterized protein n=1 Tax=Pseudogymnoascus destructans (strain ATCC MYA-4855 / 20631-21) TaxID=658429 RepID=L8FW87_PSED2|nr:hypothetical protein GMDG_07169 [Pseudogymnoascus destructans 20631-21]